MVTMEMLKRKQSLEEELSLCKWMLAIEHRREMRQKIGLYINQVQTELLNFLR